MTPDSLFAALPQRLRICEVGPRDGLQNESVTLDLPTRLGLIEGLAYAGLQRIEVGAFVSPRWVPQMAATAELCERLERRPGVRYSALVPNMKGVEAALIAPIDEIAVFTAASETFCRRNINCSIEESFARFAPVIARAKAGGLAARGYVSCIAGCPYEGKVPVARVVEVAARLHAMGCREVSLGDTIGVGTPRQIATILTAVAAEVPLDRLALHAHDTYGQALANILAGLELGLEAVDSAVAGLGGCPYAQGAAGNVATEDLVYMLEGLGIATGIDLDALIRTGGRVSQALGRSPRSRLAEARPAGAISRR